MVKDSSALYGCLCFICFDFKKKTHYFFNSYPRATYTYNYSSLKTKTSQKTLYPQLQIMCEIPAESFVCVGGLILISFTVPFDL